VTNHLEPGTLLVGEKQQTLIERLRRDSGLELRDVGARQKTARYGHDRKQESMMGLL